MDHAVALPLTDKEVVPTFDDGPVPFSPPNASRRHFSWSEKWLVRIPQQCAGFLLKVIPSAPIAKFIPCALENCRPHLLN